MTPASTGDAGAEAEPHTPEDPDPDPPDDPDTAVEPAARAVPIAETSQEEVLALIRKTFNAGVELDFEEALRTLAGEMGYHRIGPRIRETLGSDLNTALRRRILSREQGVLSRATGSIQDYDREFLKKTLLAALGKGWEEQEDLIRQSARRLGFARTGPNIQKAFKSAITGLLRQTRLERDRTRLRKIPE